MMRKTKVSIPIYHGELVIIQCENWDKVNEKYNTKIKKGYDGVVFKHEEKSGYTHYIAAFTGTPKPYVIAHECVHLVNHIFIDRGIELDTHNDEPQAYLTGWFYKQIDNFFKQATK